MEGVLRKPRKLVRLGMLMIGCLTVGAAVTAANLESWLMPEMVTLTEDQISPAGPLTYVAKAPPGPDGVESVTYDVTPRRIGFLPPATPLPEKGPPQGWSHLVIRINPRPATGDVNKLTPAMVQLAQSCFIVLVANVASSVDAGGQVTYRLSGLAGGCGGRLGNQDYTLTTQHPKYRELGFLERTLLARREAQMQHIQVVVRSGTMAIVDPPVLMLRNGVHKQVKRRYAIMADPRTGRMETLVWLLEPGADGRQVAVGPLDWLPPNCIDPCPLHVDGNHFTLGIPTEEAFATIDKPRGEQQFPIPPAVQELAGKSVLTADEARVLNRTLWALLPAN